ncbi:hypothetical protein HJG60_011116 [Phyllostomus discolor]|uniref:Uncharacterized protein n=1 Tax=Phyllostomus discolor TaxID=89673 RepID=A0A833ZW32_9CHIR|nr:hypothetical protein HJG60_011116 [Phyllostomus discolor]
MCPDPSHPSTLKHVLPTPCNEEHRCNSSVCDQPRSARPLALSAAPLGRGQESPFRAPSQRIGTLACIWNEVSRRGSADTEELGPRRCSLQQGSRRRQSLLGQRDLSWVIVFRLGLDCRVFRDAYSVLLR